MSQGPSIVKSFTAMVEHDDRGRVWITIPFDPNAEWGKRPRHHIQGDLNGTAFEGSLGVRGGRVHLPLNKALRQAAGVSPGDTVAITLQPTTERSEEIPAELRDLLAEDRAAKDFFDGLSGFHRRQYAGWVEQAKQTDTKRRRAEEVVTLLRERKKSR